jgi:hypothetical protein
VGSATVEVAADGDAREPLLGPYRKPVATVNAEPTPIGPAVNGDQS